MKKVVTGIAASFAILIGVATVYFRANTTEASLHRRPQSSLTREESIVWITSYRQAMAEAKRTGKPIFLEYRCAP